MSEVIVSSPQGRGEIHYLGRDIGDGDQYQAAWFDPDGRLTGLGLSYSRPAAVSRVLQHHEWLQRMRQQWEKEKK